MYRTSAFASQPTRSYLQVNILLPNPSRHLPWLLSRIHVAPALPLLLQVACLRFSPPLSFLSTSHLFPASLPSPSSSAFLPSSSPYYALSCIPLHLVSRAFRYFPHPPPPPRLPPALPASSVPPACHHPRPPPATSPSLSRDPARLRCICPPVAWAVVVALHPSRSLRVLAFLSAAASAAHALGQAPSLRRAVSPRVSFSVSPLSRPRHRWRRRVVVELAGAVAF